MVDGGIAAEDGRMEFWAPCRVGSGGLSFSVHLVIVASLVLLKTGLKSGVLGGSSAVRGEGDFRGDAEAGAEHALLGRDVADVVDRHLALLVRVAELEADAELLVNAVEDVVQGHLVVGLEGEAVDVDHGQLGRRVRLEELLVARVDALVVVDEGVGRGGQVHDEVGDCWRDGDAFWLGGRVLGFASGLFGFDDGGVAAG